MINVPLWQRILVVAICVFGVLYALPNFLGSRMFEDLPDWMPGKTVNLGLDLQGGSHLLLQVDFADVRAQQILAIGDVAKQSLIEIKARWRDFREGSDTVTFGLRDESKIEAVREKLEALGQGITVDQDSNGMFVLGLSEEALIERRNQVLAQSIEIIRRRIDELGTREPVIQRTGTDWILVQVPGVDDPERLKDVISATAKLTFHIVHSSIYATESRPPPGYLALASADELGPEGKPLRYLVRRRVALSGERLTDAQPSFEQNAPVVSFRFDSLGAKQFGRLTTKNVENLLGIVLDGKVISAPRIREPIVGGSGIITGRFSVPETQDLALLLRAGALPAKVHYLEERTVGPGLGRDSVEAGKIASMIGLALVIVFMIVVYGRFGLMADVALLFNVTLVLAVLSGLQATLTLPGIAGIVLTMGMAVDANVLIFERIREEIKTGRSPISAVDAGYRRALTTIIDSNLTTLIAAVLLFIFGSGPVKGFAVTLSIGLVTSMFTAIMVTRLLVILWLRHRRRATLPI